MSRILVFFAVASLFACGGTTAPVVDGWSDGLDVPSSDSSDLDVQELAPPLDLVPESPGETQGDTPEVQPVDTPPSHDDSLTDVDTPTDSSDEGVLDSGPDTPQFYCPEGHQCGLDEQGFNCGVCPNGWPCVENRCGCKPICTGKCGGDLCGGSCGTCDSGTFCDRGACVAPSCPEGFVAVQAGTFMMGSPLSEKLMINSALERQRTVSLTRAFCVATTELTQQQWLETMGGEASASCGQDCPMPMNWFEAAKYCNERSKKEGLAECFLLQGCTGTIGKDFACSTVTFAGLDCLGYRMPISAEWEFAARAGTTTATYKGDLQNPFCGPDDVLDQIAWFCGNSNDATHPVRGKAPNLLGLYDVLGNVGEWCIDGLPLTVPPYWDNLEDPFRSPPQGNSPGNSSAVTRGGSWWEEPAYMRAGYPATRNAKDARADTGLRLVRTLKAP